LQLDVPQSVVLPDGRTAQVREVSAQVSEGKIVHIVYTVEKENGAWTKLSGDEVDAQQPVA